MDEGLFGPDALAPLSAWCDCPDAPTRATGAVTLLDHPGGCEFPAGACTVRAHRVMTHKSCGRPIRMRFCGCIPSGYTFDCARGWWVHYVCGWPTRAWYEAEGRPAPDSLAGLRPVTLHEYAVVPKNPKQTYDRLTDEQKRINAQFDGVWVRD